jgi:hypothetical protein
MSVFHAASLEIAVPAEHAFAYLSDGLKQSDWTLGSWNREQVGENLFRGTSLFDGSDTYVRLHPSAETLVVDYDVGSSPERMLRVNSARVVAGPLVGRAESTCVVTLMKYRTPSQTDAEWERACVAFDTEIHMIKGRLELGF